MKYAKPAQKDKTTCPHFHGEVEEVDLRLGQWKGASRSLGREMEVG
jgi:hypothetical protein